MKLFRVGEAISSGCLEYIKLCVVLPMKIPRPTRGSAYRIPTIIFCLKGEINVVEAVFPQSLGLS
jgi:hypothetical protein